MHILVTGGAGYIGSHVVKQLLEAGGHEVSIIDNLSTGSRATLETLEQIAIEGGKGELRFYRADLADLAAMEKIFLTNRFDALIHFAASIVVPESVEDPLKYYLNNTVNTTHLLRLCRTYGVGKMIFSSTAAVYGEPDPSEGNPKIDEDYPTRPINPYGRSKLMSERIIRDTAAADDGFRYVILRYFNVAGADMHNRIGQCFPNATHLIKVAAECASGKRQGMAVFGSDYPTSDGTCVRDYIHVDDLASAHIRALEYLEKGGESDLFNCGYGHGFSVREVIETMKAVSGIDFPVTDAPRRPGDPAQLVSENAKIVRRLGWNPRYDNLAAICSSALAWEKRE